MPDCLHGAVIYGLGDNELVMIFHVQLIRIDIPEEFGEAQGKYVPAGIQRLPSVQQETPLGESGL